jgi:RNA polymerase sigma-70 factor, ECF subfamily
MARPSADPSPLVQSPSAVVPAGEITTLLRAWTSGDEEAGDRLFRLIYPQLHRVVSRRLRAERPAGNLQTTDFLHETYLRLVRQRQVDWKDRAHFFAVAATLVRRVIVDHLRHGSRRRRGGGSRQVSVDEVVLAVTAPPVDLLALDRALTELAVVNPTASRVVDLRYFGGLSLEETADVLGLGRATAVRTWRFARSWLGQRLAVP